METIGMRRKDNMNIFKRLIDFLNKFKKDEKKALSTETVLALNEAKDKFRESIRIVDVAQKRKIEVLKNVGDGTGIQTQVCN